MFPVALNLTKIPILLIGSGPLVARRQAQLAEYGAMKFTVKKIPSPLVGEGGEQREPGEGVSSKRDSSLRDTLSLALSHKGRGEINLEDIREHTIVMVAGLPREQAENIVEAAHAAGKLVNVEDINELCDFYFTANVKRGDLIIAVSTSGASPTLARVIRDWLAERFGEEWAGHLREMLSLRKTWKTEGADMTQVMEKTKRHLQEQGWLNDKSEAA